MDRDELIEIMEEAASAIMWDREGCMIAFDDEDRERFNKILDLHDVER